MQQTTKLSSNKPLDHITSTYNSTMSSMSKHSPWEIGFGQPMRFPPHIIVDKVCKTNDMNNHSVVSSDPHENSYEPNDPVPVFPEQIVETIDN